MAVGGRGQLGHAALGAPPVPGGGTARAPVAGHALCRRCVRLVPGAPRRPQGAEALVRLRGFSPGTARRRRTSDATDHRRGGDVRAARARDPAHGYGQVALLPDSGAVALPQDRRADSGDLAAGGADGGSGGGAGGARHRLLRLGQRAADHARARRRAGPGAAGGCRDPARISRAAPGALAAPRPGPARDRRLGTGRGPLPVALGPRLPARLHLRGPLHPGAGQWRRPAAGAVSHRHRQTGRGGRHHPPLPRPTRDRTDRHQRRRGENQSDLRGHAHLRGREIRRHPPSADLAPAAGNVRGRHYLLRHAPAERGGGGVPATEGGGRGPFPRRPAAGDQEERAAALHRRGAAHHRRHQRLRHGHRQTRREAGGPRRHPGLAGELPPGGGPRRARPGRRALRAAVCRRRRRAAVQHVRALTPHEGGDPRHSAGAAQAGPEETPGGRGGGHHGRDPGRGRGSGVRA